MEDGKSASTLKENKTMRLDLSQLEGNEKWKF